MPDPPPPGVPLAGRLFLHPAGTEEWLTSVKRFLVLIGSLVVLALAWAAPLSAQPETPTLQGYVRAQSGKPLAGVLTRVTNLRTVGKSEQQTTTDGTGAYKFTGGGEAPPIEAYPCPISD